MANEQLFPGEDQSEEETIPEEIEYISIEGFEVVKRGDILHVCKKQTEKEEE